MDRAEALALVIPVLEKYFQDNTLEQTLLLWSHLAEDFPQRIPPILSALEALANDTSLELRPILVRHGWINLFRMVDGTPVIYSADEHREWVRQLIPRLQEVADAHRPA